MLGGARLRVAATRGMSGLGTNILPRKYGTEKESEKPVPIRVHTTKSAHLKEDRFAVREEALSDPSASSCRSSKLAGGLKLNRGLTGVCIENSCNQPVAFICVFKLDPLVLCPQISKHGEGGTCFHYQRMTGSRMSLRLDSVW